MEKHTGPHEIELHNSEKRLPLLAECEVESVVHQLIETLEEVAAMLEPRDSEKLKEIAHNTGWLEALDALAEAVERIASAMERIIEKKEGK